MRAYVTSRKTYPVTFTRICVTLKATLRVLRWPARSERPGVTAQHYVVLRANKIGQKTRKTHPGVTAAQELATTPDPDADSTIHTTPISAPKFAEGGDKIKAANTAEASTEKSVSSDKSSVTASKTAEGGDKLGPRYSELREAACAVLRWADPHYRWTG